MSVFPRTVPIMKPIEPLPDRWSSRDLSVLMATARALDSGEHHVEPEAVADEVGLMTSEVGAAYDALVGAYLSAGRTPGTMGYPKGSWVATGLTERGRRAVGLWPSGEGVDALIDALRKAEETAEAADDRSALRRAWSSIGGVSREVMVDVLGAVVARQSGLG